MFPQIACPRECIVALAAFVLTFLRSASSNESLNVLPQIFQTSPQILYLRKGIFTLVAFVLLFSTVCFQMFPQIVCSKGVIITLVAFVWLFTTVCFKYVYSKCLHRRMHNHTGCTCATFLHCAFLNVPSNYLPQRMHSHIGCICLTFLLCVFSNGSSNGLPKRRYIRTGCTCQLSCHHLGNFAVINFHPFLQFEASVFFCCFGLTDSQKGKIKYLFRKTFTLNFFWRTPSVPSADNIYV